MNRKPSDWIRAAVGVAAVGASLQAAEVPFQLEEGLIWITLEDAATARPLQFLLDSGAAVSVLDNHTCAQLGLQPGAPVRVRGVDCVVTGRWPTPWSAHWGGVAVPSRLLTLDLKALSQRCQRHVDGLLGFDFFRNHALSIDFSREVIDIDPHPKARFAGSSIQLRARGSAAGVEAQTHGSNIRRLRLDTGCAAALHLVQPGHDLHDLPTETAVGLAPIKVATGLTDLLLGSELHRAIPTRLHARPIFPGEDGLLGVAFLTRYQRVHIDIHRRTLILGQPATSGISSTP